MKFEVVCGQVFTSWVTTALVAYGYGLVNLVVFSVGVTLTWIAMEILAR